MDHAGTVLVALRVLMDEVGLLDVRSFDVVERLVDVLEVVGLQEATLVLVEALHVAHALEGRVELSVVSSSSHGSLDWNVERSALVQLLLNLLGGIVGQLLMEAS